jgi:hypothetical protein
MPHLEQLTLLKARALPNPYWHRASHAPARRGLRRRPFALGLAQDRDHGCDRCRQARG